MVCTSNELLGLKNFPKGLRVLLLDEDLNSASEIRSKLEEMDYIVSIFCNEDEALSAISSKSQIFHIAIVEVSTENSQGSFTFLDNVKDLPTIMTSSVHCLSTMMKCIAQGAVEFLHKPLSEDKLRNVWQHVVHKAFNAGGSNLAESLKPVKESISSILQLQLEHKEESENQSMASETKNESSENKSNIEQSSASDKCPAPLTPQLKHGGKLLDFPTEKDSVDQDVGDSKSVETTCENSVAEFSSHVSPLQRSNTVVKEEDGSKSESNISPCPQKKNGASVTNADTRNERKVSNIHNSRETRSSRNKMKVDWTPELHKKFVKAVEQLGVDQAIPSRILESMKVHGLTRHNVASHLQKYRMHRRHILPKVDDRRLSHRRDLMHRGYYQNKPPVMAYPVWGSPGGPLPGPSVQMWGPPGYSPWQQADSWHWKPYQTMYADAWGCPVMPPPHPPYYSFPQNAAEYPNMSPVANGCCTTPSSFDLHPEDELLDKVVKEAMSKPWLPLPLGLKPPSTESVLAELCRQGIPKIPPTHTY